MPIHRGYKRRGRYNKRSRRPINYMATAQKGLFLAGKALSVAQGVKAIVNSEKHTYSRTISSSTIGNTGTMTEITNVPQGDDFCDRTGRSILAKSVELNGWVFKNSSATTTVLRVIIFKDLNADGSNPTATDLLTADNTYSLRNPAPHQMKRFKIMLDKNYFLDDAKSKMAKVHFFRELNHHIKYASTSADSNEGSLWVYLVSNESTNLPTLNLESRLRFYDN